MKYLYLLLFLFLFKEANSQIFERTYQTAPLNYHEKVTAAEAFGEITIVAMNEDTMLKGNRKLVKLNKDGDIIKTSYFPKEKHYNIVNIININDSSFLILLYEYINQNPYLVIAKVDLNLDVHWIKKLGYMTNNLTYFKKINKNKFVLFGNFQKNNNYKYLYIDSVGNLLPYNSTFTMFSTSDLTQDIVESNDTVFSIQQTFAFSDHNALRIVSRRKNESINLNFTYIDLESYIEGDYIEIKNENIIVYGQTNIPNGIRKFRYTLDKNLNEIKIDSLKIGDGIYDYMEYFAKDSEYSYYIDYHSTRITKIDKSFKVKSIQYIPARYKELESFSVKNNTAIISGAAYLSSQFTRVSYVHRFNPNVPLGVDNNNVDNFNLYPNPFNNEFSLSFDKEQAFVNMCIYNTLGQKMFNKRFEKTSSVLVDDLDLGKGVYVVEIVTEEGRLTRRIIKQ